MMLMQTSECRCSMLSNNILHNLLEASMQGRMWGTQSSINPTSHWHEHNWWWDTAWCCSLYKMLQQQHLYLLSHNIYTSTKKNIFLGKSIYGSSLQTGNYKIFLRVSACKAWKLVLFLAALFIDWTISSKIFNRPFGRLKLLLCSLYPDNQIQCWYFVFSSCLSMVNTEDWTLVFDCAAVPRVRGLLY